MSFKAYISIIIAAFIVISCSTESTPVYKLTTSTNPTEGGTVTQSAVEADEGENITITANPKEHWLFDGWQGDLTGSQNPGSILMDRDKSVTARFVKRDYPLTINIEGSGEVTEEDVTAKTTDYQHGTVVQLTSEPNDGWVFYEWSGDLNGNENPKTIDKGKEVTSVFKSIDELLAIEISGEGTVDIQQESSEDNPSRRTVTLTSKPSLYWNFIEWQGSFTGTQNPVNIEIDKTKTVTAVFEINTYSLNTGTKGEGSISVDPQKDIYEHGESIELTALPSQGWSFVGWEGTYSGSDNPLSITIESDVDITGVFEQASYEVSVTAIGQGSVSYQPVKEKYEYGDEIQLQATPSADYEFIRWQSGLSSSNQSETFTVTGNHEISAVFQSVLEAVKQRWGSLSSINNRLLSAGLSLENGLPGVITITNFRLFNQNGTLVGQSTETHNVASGTRLTYSISFNTFVATTTFSSYTGDWLFTYKGNNYRKTAQVGSFGSASKIISGETENTVIDIETFEP